MAVEIPVKPIRQQRDEPPRESEILADAAKRIMREEVYVMARDNLRLHHLELLAHTDPGDTELIVRLQAVVRAIDGLDAELVKFTQGAPRQPRKVI